MADFLQAHQKVILNEGLYSNDEGDSGGETVYGIARNIDKDWRGWSIVDQYRNDPGFPKILSTLSEFKNSVAEYYRTHYWNPIRGDELVIQEIANNVYDSAVNIGIKPAIILAQRAEGIPETGRMDEVTLNKLNNK